MIGGKESENGYRRRHALHDVQSNSGIGHGEVREQYPEQTLLSDGS